MRLLKKAARNPTHATSASKTSDLFKAGLFLYLISKSGPVKFTMMLAWITGMDKKKARQATARDGLINITKESPDG